ncbi:MAG: DUF4340 domain-containing protein [Polyangiaceae bacterium]|nr:DUF4340 domain-containing protein [Polyangiaceae bacterium]
MRSDRSILVHLGLVVVAALFAVFVWTRDKKAASPTAQTDVTVWQGRAADVERIAFEGKRRRVTLEAKQDKAGRYFVGSTERDAPPPAGDAGAEAPAPAAKSATFVSVGGANKLAEVLAPLKALRAIGKLGDDRAGEFGLDDPEGTLTVTLRGAERKLVFGGPTPGGGDRYAKDPASGEVYAIKGDVYRDLDAADSRLLERDLHEWKDAEVTRAKILAGGKARELTRGGAEGKKFWADPASPDQNDETAGNWMSKLDRLRPTEYAAAAPSSSETVARVEYAGADGELGFLELVKGPPGSSGKPDYYLVTERTRLHGKVPATLGEQVEQDVGAVVK